MKSTTRRTYIAQAPNHPPLTSKRKGEGARLIAERHFGARVGLHDMTTEDGRTIEYTFTCGGARLTVRETAA